MHLIESDGDEFVTIEEVASPVDTGPLDTGAVDTGAAEAKA